VPEEQISEDQLERVRREFERFNRGDFDGLREFIADDVLVERVGDLPALHGWDAFRQMLEPDAFEWMRIHPRDWVVNGDKLLLHADIHARGAGSGIEMDIEGWMVWTFSDGIVTRIASFQEEEDARAAAGLGQNDSP
jgi:ketosteroid isomerase-like protein